MVTIFLDDSDDDKGDVVTLAGYVATDAAWERFERATRKWFDHCGLPYLHTTDLYRRKGEFRDWTPEQTAEFARDTHQKFLAPLVSFGISASIFRPVLGPIRTDGSAVSHCFQLIVDFLFENPGFQKSLDKSGGNLSVVVEVGSYQQEVEEVFSIMNKRQPDFLGSLTFEGKDGRIALQMSDFLAYFIRRTDNNALRRNTGSKAGQRDLEFFSNAIGDISINRFFVPATPVKSPPAKPQS